MSTDEQYGQDESKMTPEASPGQVLQTGRLKAGLSVEEVANRLKVLESYVLAIESNEFNKLPGLVFSRGYVRSYARVLGLDGNELVGHFDRFTGHSGVETSHLKAGAPVMTNRRLMSPAVAWGATLLTVILVGTVSYYRWNSDKRSTSGSEDISHEQTSVGVEPAELSTEEGLLPAQVDLDGTKTKVIDPELESEPQAQVDTMSKEVEEPGLVDSAGVEEVIASVAAFDNKELPPEMGGLLVRLVIKFAEDCWIQVKDMSDNALYTDIQRAGSNLELEVPSSVQLRFGNINGVADLKFDGKEVAIKVPASGRRVASLVLNAG